MNSFQIDNVLESLVISFRNKIPSKSALVLGLLMVSSLLFLINSSQPIEGSEFISSSSDMETFVVKDLENSKTYVFTVTYDTFYQEFDVGFAIYTNENFRDKNKVLTQDDTGDDFETANYTATSDGDVYLGVWINGNDYGFVDLTIIEQGTLNEISFEDHNPSIWVSLRWVWIMLGSIVGFAIIFAIIVFTFFIRAAKKTRWKSKRCINQRNSITSSWSKEKQMPWMQKS